MTFFYLLVAITGYMAYGNEVSGETFRELALLEQGQLKTRSIAAVVCHTVHLSRGGLALGVQQQQHPPK